MMWRYRLVVAAAFLSLLLVSIEVGARVVLGLTQRVLADALTPFVLEGRKGGSRMDSEMLTEHCRN